jgi:hypothetical protein
MSQARGQHDTSSKQAPFFPLLLGVFLLFFDCEDGVDHFSNTLVDFQQATCYCIAVVARTINHILNEVCYRCKNFMRYILNNILSCVSIMCNIISSTFLCFQCIEYIVFDGGVVGE